MDRRCVYYRKPLLESGTLGTKGNVQVSLSNCVYVCGRTCMKSRELDSLDGLHVQVRVHDGPVVIAWAQVPTSGVLQCGKREA